MATAIGRPRPRLIRAPDDAEVAAAEWMTYFGYQAVRRTQATRDGGIDVEAEGAVAQVKDHGHAIGRPHLQQLHGAALGRQTLFFARSGFTRDAAQWADTVGMALFGFDLQGEPTPVNAIARNVSAARKPKSGVSASTLTEPVPERLPDAARAALLRLREGGVFRREELVEAWRTAVPVFELRYDITETVGRRGRRVRQSSTVVVLDGIASALVPTGVVQRLRASDGGCLQPTASMEHTVREIQSCWSKYCRLQQPAALERAAVRLTGYGIPLAQAVTLLVLAQREVPHPVLVGAFHSRDGERLVVLDEAGMQPMPAVGQAVTAAYAYRVEELRAGSGRALEVR